MEMNHEVQEMEMNENNEPGTENKPEENDLEDRMKDAFVKALMSVRKKCYNAARSDIYEFIGNIYADDLYATYPCNDHDGFVAGVEAVKDELRKIIIDSNPTWA